MEDVKSKIGYSYRVMLVEENGVNFTVSCLKATASQKSLSNALNFLNSMLITEIIELFENFVD